MDNEEYKLETECPHCDEIIVVTGIGCAELKKEAIELAETNLQDGPLSQSTREKARAFLEKWK